MTRENQDVLNKRSLTIVVEEWQDEDEDEEKYWGVHQVQEEW